ncbi:hypothetical protein ED312_19345 [Sinomicrobium pectinilyticum]|uniref:Uncharacterized protein n=1 Tax=Sinomicrobium pectinilyticum TaxID=1084421 RepID=A0A3N0DRF8_SINP1|nr:hypothetical protein [Sinomicrobium pectinilyticum]RNL78220.1 hypothetical protein ED312_19345 [Sinomicrobium pectinilyticum]
MYKLSANYSKFVRTFDTKDDVIKEIEKIITDKHSTIGNIRSFTPERTVDKNQSLDYLIAYADFILEDHFISGEELNDFETLKRIFRIKEGDFIRLKSFQVKEILKKQFIRMYSDDNIDKKEAIEKVNLQLMFDLSFDEFEKLKEDEIIASLRRGANPKDLDISKLPPNFRL